MEKLKEVLPYLLLVSFLGLSHYKQPQIADSIIIIALSALCGYKLYLDSRKTPDYSKLFKEEIEKHKKELEDVKTVVGMYNMAQKQREKSQNAVW
jgi:hypothetical protein